MPDLSRDIRVFPPAGLVHRLARREKRQHELRQGESTAASDIDDRVRNLILEGKKIEAIKLYRETTGLKAAKDAVEGVEREE